MMNHPSNQTAPSSISATELEGGGNTISSSTHAMTAYSSTSSETITILFVILLHVAYLYQWNARRPCFESFSIQEAVKHPRLWYRMVIFSLFSHSHTSHHHHHQQHQQRWWLSLMLFLYQVHLVWSCRAVESFYYPYFGLALVAWTAINQALVAVVVQRCFLLPSSSSSSTTTTVEVPWTTSTTTSTPSTTAMIIRQGVGGGCTSLTITWLVVFSHLFQYVGIPVVPLDPLVSLPFSEALSKPLSLSSPPIPLLSSPPPELSRRVTMILLTAFHVVLVHDRINAASSLASTGRGGEEFSVSFKVRCCLACLLQPLVGWISGNVWTLGLLDFLVEPYWGGWFCSFWLLVSVLTAKPHWEPLPGLVIWSAPLNHSNKNDDDDDNDDNNHQQTEQSEVASNEDEVEPAREFTQQRGLIYGRLPEFSVMEVDSDDDDDAYDPGNDDEERVIRRSLLGGAVRSRRGRVDLT